MAIWMPASSLELNGISSLTTLIYYQDWLVMVLSITSLQPPYTSWGMTRAPQEQH